MARKARKVIKDDQGNAFAGRDRVRKAAAYYCAGAEYDWAKRSIRNAVKGYQPTAFGRRFWETAI